jgi:hypothetical protein
LPDLELVVAHVATKGLSPRMVSRKYAPARSTYLRLRRGSFAMFAAMRPGLVACEQVGRLTYDSNSARK